MSDVVNMVQHDYRGKPETRNILTKLVIGFSILALLSPVVITLDFFLFGLNIYLPLLFQMFMVGFYLCVSIAIILILISIPLQWNKTSIVEKVARLVFLSVILLINVSFKIFNLASLSTNYGMYLLVKHNGGTNRLVQWADSIFEKPYETVLDTNYGGIKAELLSDQVKKIERNTILVTRKQGKYIIITTGGGGFIEFGWGIVVTSKDMQISNYPQTDKLFKWQDRVYSYMGNELLFGPDEEGQ